MRAVQSLQVYDGTSMTNAPDTSSVPTSSSSSGYDERQKWQAFWVCVGVAALTILDLSKVNVGLPSIEASLGAGPTALQLIVAGYALAFGLSLVPSGRLGDLKSRRLMFVIGLSSFTVASVLCAIAPTVELLVAARILQGVAAGIQMPQVLGLIQQLFQGRERGRAFGLFGAVIGVSTAFGPTIGGLLIAVGGAQDGWRLLFWMNVPLGIVAIVFALKLLPRTSTAPSGHNELDLMGIVLLGLTILTLMLPFVLTTGQGDDPLRWLFLIGFAGFGALFVWWEQRYKARGKSPVVHFSLFSLASYRNGTLIATVYFCALPATFLLTTLFLQQGLGLEPVYAGMVTIPFALTSAVAAFYGGRIVEKYGRSLVVLGLVLVGVGFVVLLLAATLTPPEYTPWAMAGGMLVAGTGGGFVISPNQTLTLAEVPVEMGGVAGSMGQVGQRAGTAIGTAAAVSTFYSVIAGRSEGSTLDIYHEAYRSGFLVTIALVAGALVLALLDLRARRQGRVGEAADAS
ncbi:EmrB/QacA subfamily drug resistance transporter [Frigoribacterium sp. PhB107]|nr:EmrB/QacA subfamily drug resistance transporter [Frigoribacterium sp. PhB107]